MNSTYTTLILTTSRKEKPCDKCHANIRKGETYRRAGMAWLGGSRSKYCTHCVGFIRARYSFFVVPNPTPEELSWEAHYDRKLLELIEKRAKEQKEEYEQI